MKFPYGISNFNALTHGKILGSLWIIEHDSQSGIRSHPMKFPYGISNFNALTHGKILGSLWIPDWSKRTTVGSTMTDDEIGSLFSTITASYTTPLWFSEKANLRKIS